jgi:uncharacterized protein YdhG (YjbR/CyaY superfamily)
MLIGRRKEAFDLAKSDHPTVGAYIAAYPAAVQAVLQTVRAAILEALPQARESISYQMPSYQVDGRPVIYFAAWKKHYAIYPATVGLVEAFGEALAPYEVDKGTIRLPYGKPPPADLISKIAAFLAQEAAGKAA